jgi:hypothetical protein
VPFLWRYKEENAGDGQLPAKLCELIEKEGDTDKKHHPHFAGCNNTWDAFPDPRENSCSRLPQVVFEAVAYERADKLSEWNLIDASRVLFHVTPPLMCLVADKKKLHGNAQIFDKRRIPFVWLGRV